MKKIAATALFVSATTLLGQNFAAAQTAEAPVVQAPPPGLLADSQMAGQGLLRFVGLDLYRARLWVAPGFDANNYTAHPLALELLYHRNFSAEAIAKRSLDEMQRVGRFSKEQGARWQKALQAALPDIKPGDRLVGVYQPGAGAVFKMGGRVVGEVPDAEFSRLFFGIWLSPQTSEPELRRELIAGAGPRQ